MGSGRRRAQGAPPKRGGDEGYPNLQVKNVWEAPPHPGTQQECGEGAPRHIRWTAAIAQTDWHNLAEHRFAEDVANTLAKVQGETSIKGTDCRCAATLASLRAALAGDLKRAVIAEVDRDLTKRPFHEIQKGSSGPMHRDGDEGVDPYPHL
jgi:protein required for attachment to host cells